MTDKVGFYTEIYTEHGDAWIVTADVGLTLGLDDNSQLDAGLNLGVTSAADDIAVFIGYSRRF